ncbi:hypothetical protein [Ochrobactrum sp. AN78]|uniref:hypothetical protein n=1 Tax=Ochrobactrum sp. AN78 TaxID=3039853 RepID=UPI0021F71600|nr:MULTISPECIES: hypothetical protein [Brucella/Ochrobactrum group]MCV9908511.1 hypothetical protein [Brucella sp. HL-2]MDH7790479.1 invasion protein IalB [Ochrobactrum sp. AN78]
MLKQFNTLIAGATLAAASAGAVFAADDKMAASLGKGKVITVKTVSDDGKGADFSISFNGFQNTMNRVNELMN